MADTYTLIEKITVGAAGASSVEFTSIPQTYTDLVIRLSVRDNQSGATGNDNAINFNGSATSFTGRRIYGNGATVNNDTVAPYAGSSTSAGTTASTFSNTEIYIPNYAGSNNKSFSVDSTVENNATTAYAILYAGLWSNTAAITSVKIVRPSTFDFVQYSTFYLYGIAKEGVNPSLPSAPYATGGDSILFDGTYWYHTFRTSGTFTPKKGLSCDILAVAGGGGGGHYRGGGGGAGGVIYWAGQSVSTASTVTIGAGGAGITSGSNSQFASLTVAVGGGAGSNSSGSNGGSGGGGGYDNGTAGTTTQTGTGATAYYGNNAGTISGATSGGAGGGGAGAVGGNGIVNSGGVGGNGINTYSSWHTATGTGVSGYIAGGGGGGGFSTVRAGGSGGGGAGGTNSALSVAGVANTGSGGGGGGDQGTAPEYNGSAGGSGLIIVRYAA